MIDPTQDQIEGALASALFYRAKGWNALPSRTNIKGPMLPTYAEYWNERLPASIYSEWHTSNVQVMCGSRWGLMVVDCDGDEAHNAFLRIKKRHGCHGPLLTWICRTGGGGWHYWFRIPGLRYCESGRVWGLWDTDLGTNHQGDWAKHKEVRILGEKSLVIAPPSLHVVTGKEYRWFPRRGPDDLPDPMIAPDWILELPRIAQPVARAPWEPARLLPPVKTSIRPSGAFPTREEILSGIPDKIALAASWGLRIADREPSPRGWVSCHAIDREDCHPSAAISQETGVYTDRREGIRMSFFDLGVALGAYQSWEDARADLAYRYLIVS